ncbi:MAG: histidinol-phosphate transaminase, partial [Gammaproteobacteria bacterium]
PSPCLEAAERLLETDPVARARAEIDAIRERREALSKALAQSPAILEVWPSAGNFLLVRCRDAAAVIAACSEAGLLIRDFSRVPDLEGCVRITVGEASHHARLLTAIGACVPEVRHG